MAGSKTPRERAIVGNTFLSILTTDFKRTDFDRGDFFDRMQGMQREIDEWKTETLTRTFQAYGYAMYSTVARLTLAAQVRALFTAEDEFGRAITRDAWNATWVEVGGAVVLMAGLPRLQEFLVGSYGGGGAVGFRILRSGRPASGGRASAPVAPPRTGPAATSRATGVGRGPGRLAQETAGGRLPQPSSRPTTGLSRDTMNYWRGRETTRAVNAEARSRVLERTDVNLAELDGIITKARRQGVRDDFIRSLLRELRSERNLDDAVFTAGAKLEIEGAIRSGDTILVAPGDLAAFRQMATPTQMESVVVMETGTLSSALAKAYLEGRSPQTWTRAELDVVRGILRRQATATRYRRADFGDLRGGGSFYEGLSQAIRAEDVAALRSINWGNVRVAPPTAAVPARPVTGGAPRAGSGAANRPAVTPDNSTIVTGAGARAGSGSGAPTVRLDTSTVLDRVRTGPGGTARLGTPTRTERMPGPATGPRLDAPTVIDRPGTGPTGTLRLETPPTVIDRVRTGPGGTLLLEVPPTVRTGPGARARLDTSTVIDGVRTGPDGTARLNTPPTVIDRVRTGPGGTQRLAATPSATGPVEAGRRMNRPRVITGPAATAPTLRFESGARAGTRPATGPTTGGRRRSTPVVAPPVAPPPEPRKERPETGGGTGSSGAGGIITSIPGSPARRIIPPISITIEPTDDDSAGDDDRVVDLGSLPDPTILNLFEGGRDPSVQLMMLDSAVDDSEPVYVLADARRRALPSDRWVISTTRSAGMVVPIAWSPAGNPFERARTAGWRGPQDLTDLKVVLTSLGSSTGETFAATFFNGSGEQVAMNLEGLVIEPLTREAEEQARGLLREQLDRLAGANRVTARLNAYCLEFLRLPPDVDRIFRIAPGELQQRFTPLREVLKASRQLRDLGLLNADSDPLGYFHSIRQWALWAAEQDMDSEAFTQSFVEHTRKNLEASGRTWTREIAGAVSALAPSRWRDVSNVLEAAGLRPIR